MNLSDCLPKYLNGKRVISYKVLNRDDVVTKNTYFWNGNELLCICPRYEFLLGSKCKNEFKNFDINASHSPLVPVFKERLG